MAKRRVDILTGHLNSSKGAVNFHSTASSKRLEHDWLNSQLLEFGIDNVEIEAPPIGCEEYFRTLLTGGAIQFVANLVRTFDKRVEQILRQRQLTKAALQQSNKLPDFPEDTRHIRQGNWQIAPLPHRLQCRHVDCGDVSPSNTQHFVQSLRSTAQGIQTDFDDGHCPTWSNQLLGLYNVYRAVHNKIPDVPEIHSAPVLMLRPRAWNMIEHNMLVDGKEVPGPLFDFGILMYHNAHTLHSKQSGPFFYLSKVEGSNEAKLWNQIFVWAQQQLDLPLGTVKACVLIENVLASFQTHEILYELRDHSAGLNCGLWDYSASFVNKFGHRTDFVLPDRSKYVNMDRHFLSRYMDLVVQTCHQHGAPATGGMSALLLPPGDSESRREAMAKACKSKLKEIKSGADGFMVYDLALIKPMHELFQRFAPTPNQIHVKRPEVMVTSKDLLLMPSGGVTLNGLKHNIGVGILFIYSWLQGKGHYYYKGAVEDSATAEISRSQVWQWIRHGCKLEDNGAQITRRMTQELIHQFLSDASTEPSTKYAYFKERENLVTASKIFEELVTKTEFPEFITSYLNLEHAFLNLH